MKVLKLPALLLNTKRKNLLEQAIASYFQPYTTNKTYIILITIDKKNLDQHYLKIILYNETLEEQTSFMKDLTSIILTVN